MAYVYEELTATEIARRLRGDSNAAWSLDGARALANWLLEYAEETGTNIELDIVALRCDFNEYEDLAAFQAEYGEEYKCVEDIEKATLVIPVLDNKCLDSKSPFIVQCF